MLVSAPLPWGCTPEILPWLLHTAGSAGKWLRASEIARCDYQLDAAPPPHSRKQFRKAGIQTDCDDHIRERVGNKCLFSSRNMG